MSVFKIDSLNKHQLNRSKITKYYLRDFNENNKTVKIKKFNFNTLDTFLKVKNTIKNNKKKLLKIKKPKNSKSWKSILKKKKTNGNNYFVSGSKVHNYLLNDPVLDWYKLYSKKGLEKRTTNYKKNKKVKKINKSEINTNDFTKGFLCNKGLEFEEKIYQQLKDKFGNDCVIVPFKGYSNEVRIELTHGLMLNGIPIIYQPFLADEETQTHGTPDLIVRSDFLNKLVKTKLLTNKEETIPSPNFSHKFHYVVIEIKWTTLYLCSNGLTLRNSNRIPAYKGQLTIYNMLIGKVQGYIPNKAFVLGKGWLKTSKNITTKSSDPFHTLGIIEFNNFDSKYIEKTNDAINWVRDVKFNGSEWKLEPPSRKELYPNMCNKYDNEFKKFKFNHARNINELTCLWNVGYKHRLNAHSKGVFNFKDPKCCSKIMGIKPSHRGFIIDKMIEVNNSDDIIIYPETLKNNDFKWKQKTKSDFYIDFETLNTNFVQSDIFNNDGMSNYIFMIGVGYEEFGKYKSKVFTTNDTSKEEELRIMREFVNFINLKSFGKSRLFHWSKAEQTILRSFSSRHPDFDFDWNIQYIDFCEILKKEPVIIKNTFSYGLKDVANSLYQNNFIKTKWEDSVNGGFGASLLACDYYKNNCSNKKIINEIEKYNLIDCKVLWEIVYFFRNY